MSLIKRIVGQSLTYSFAAAIALTTAMGLIGIDRTANAEVPSGEARESAPPERCSTHAAWSPSPASPVHASGTPESTSPRCWSAWRR